MTSRALLLLTVLLSLPAFAQQRSNELAVSYGRTNYAQAGDSDTIGISYARFFTHHIAARGRFVNAAQDLPDEQGDRSYRALSATVEYHPFRDRLLSPYAGVGIAYANARIHLARGLNFSAEDSTITAFGGAGLDLHLTPRFALGADVSYMKFDPDLGDRHGSAYHPLTMLVSAKVRF